MDKAHVVRRKKELEARFGGWTSHNIHLIDDVYTWPESQPAVPNRPGKPYDGTEGVDPRVRRVLQVASDITNEPIDRLRVLDLACLEGIFGVEFALHGAKVLAIDGREANVEMTRFAKEVHSLGNLDVALDDVRNLRKAKHGSFDVVLCLGILYHLDAPSLVPFLENIADVCLRCAIIDTHISLAAKESFAWNGKTYWGQTHPEHDASSTPEERMQHALMSIDNATAFCFTRRSLCNLLRHVGFTSVYECHNPMGFVYADRITLVAIKGRPQTLITSPLLNAPEEDWSEVMELCEYPELNADIYPNWKLADTFDASRFGVSGSSAAGSTAGGAAVGPVTAWTVEKVGNLLPAWTKERLKKLGWVRVMLDRAGRNSR